VAIRWSNSRSASPAHAAPAFSLQLSALPPTEQDRRGPWFFEVTPTDHEKLREVNLDSAGPVEELPLREIAAAIDDPFDDEEPQSSFFSEGAMESGAGGEGGEGGEVGEGDQDSDAGGEEAEEAEGDEARRR
jgi:hypothetical protein